MPITTQELRGLETRANTTLGPYNTKFVLSAHFTFDRVNDVRNVPPITLTELQSIVDQLVQKCIVQVLALKNKATFNVRCSTSHINMPCGFSHIGLGNGAAYEISAITVMRKKNFHCKDPTEFIV
jgi:hypothetical protein